MELPWKLMTLETLILWLF